MPSRGTSTPGALAAVLLVVTLGGGELAATTPPIAGTILQLTEERSTLGAAGWDAFFAELGELGMTELVVQWSVYGDVAFYPSRIVPRQAPCLGTVLERADAAGVAVLVGLVFDPGFEAAIRRDPELVEVDLRRRRLRALEVAGELLPLVAGHPSFAGWYLPEEIDDVHWLEPERRRLLAEHLDELTASLRRLGPPGATLAISGFSNTYADPASLETLWRDLLAAADVDRVLFQDGVGAGKQRLDDLSLYLGAVARAAAASGRRLQPVVEVFEQVGGPPLGEGPFRAVPAPVARVERQLAIAAESAASGILLFAAPDYLSPRHGGDAERLYRYLREPEQGAERGSAEGRDAAHAVVTTTATAADPGPSGGETSLPDDALIYELQLGLFHHYPHARNMIEDWTARGYRPYLVEVRSSQGETRYTVRLGPYASLDAAAAEGAELRRQQDAATVIRFRPHPDPG